MRRRSKLAGAPMCGGGSARSGLRLRRSTCLVDQASKFWLLDDFDLASRAPSALTPFIDLVLTFNTGISYGLFPQQGPVGPWALLAFKVVAVIFLWVWLTRAPSRLTAVALGLIIGGAVGNAIDRLHWPGVMDFVLFHIETAGFSFRWYVFNLADVAIVAGVVGLLYKSLMARGRRKSALIADINLLLGLSSVGDFPDCDGGFRCRQVGEGMPQDRIVGCKVDGAGRRTWAVKARALLLGAALAALRRVHDYSAARAGDDDAAENRSRQVCRRSASRSDDANTNQLQRTLAAGRAADAQSAAAGTARTAPAAELAERSRHHAASRPSRTTTSRSIRHGDYVTESSRPLRPDELGVHRASAISGGARHLANRPRTPTLARRRASSASTGSRRKNTRHLPANRRGPA